MNDIASVEFESASPLFFDSYERNRTTGSFILRIDPLYERNGRRCDARRKPAHGNVVAPFLDECIQPARALAPNAAVTAAERFARHGHRPAIVLAEGRYSLAAPCSGALSSNAATKFCSRPLRRHTRLGEFPWRWQKEQEAAGLIFDLFRYLGSICPPNTR